MGHGDSAYVSAERDGYFGGVASHIAGRRSDLQEMGAIQTNTHRWDIFCTVVDNYGDIGTCWRLARQLADEYQIDVRLWVDNLETFARLCPSVSIDVVVQHVGPIEVRLWPDDFPIVDVADVVIEAFACELPATYVAAMTQRGVAPVWINLEYLSAEDWVEGCHLLASPRSGSLMASSLLTKYFFFPGFTSKTGGLLRERDLLAARDSFDLTAEAEFWRGLGIQARTNGELRFSLFCYDNPALPELLHCWADGPAAVRVLACPGPAIQQIADWLGCALPTGASVQKKLLTVHAMPFLSQEDYDRLLWSCDVNFVRGEDSFVRAQWAGQPFVWQIYPQSDNAHLVKLDAFLKRYLGESGDLEAGRALPQKGVSPLATCDESDITHDWEGVSPLFEAKPAVLQFWHAWNGVGEVVPAWREFVANRILIQKYGKVWVGQLDRAGNLADNLFGFVCGQ